MIKTITLILLGLSMTACIASARYPHACYMILDDKGIKPPDALGDVGPQPSGPLKQKITYPCERHFEFTDPTTGKLTVVPK